MANGNATWGFTRSYVIAHNWVYLIAYSRELESKQIYINEIFSWTGEWQRFDVEWPVVALCFTDQPEPMLLCLGEKGQVKLAKKDGFESEEIDSSENGPAYFGALRDMRKIGEHIYVVGMRRQVFRRSEMGDVWKRIDKRVLVEKSEDSYAGFNSVDGFNEKDIYAVGWMGEIWRYDGEVWHECVSPTNVKLQAVKCAPDGFVYCVGQSGVILKGRNDEWEIINQSLTKDQFWCVEWFKDKSWLSTKNELFVLENDELQKIKIFDEQPQSFGWLHANDGVMWSVGNGHIFTTNDGKQWDEKVI